MPIRLLVDEKTSAYLPQSDVSLCLSIWHHWVRLLGIEAATAILGTLWKGTRKALFFETGENEMPEHYGLPFKDNNSKVWIEDYLNSTCDGGRVLHLGQFAAFAPGRDESDGKVKRNLYGVVR